MTLKKKSVAVLAIAGFTTATMVSATRTMKSHMMTPYEEEEEGDYDIIVSTFMLL